MSESNDVVPYIIAIIFAMGMACFIVYGFIMPGPDACFEINKTWTLFGCV